ncbi:MAG: hypothetical protein H0Z32_12000 [Bacillaceae bacterium]|nr:hypothetical protein [Bacillaceae bacterium]
MGKGIFAAVAVMLALLIGSSVYADPEKGSRSFEVPTTPEEQQIKEKIDQANNEFRQKVLDDIKKSFSLQGSDFKEARSELLNDQNFKEFRWVYMEVVKNQEEGDIMPVLYYNQNQAYILEKKSDGTNVMYTLKKDSSEWVIADKKVSPGAQIEHPLSDQS